MNDTIFALSSGSPPSGVAVIRLSGTQVRFGLETICGILPLPRQMHYTGFRDLAGSLLDRGLCVYFSAPHSFTGEDCAELHLHGSRATVRKCLDLLGSMPGFRLAEAGEFSKRAFLNGKMDLTSAEGLADLIAAETETQRKLALLLAEGGLSSLYQDWRNSLIRIRAMLEASIEFSDEDDVAERALVSTRADLLELSSRIQSHINGAKSGEIIRDGYHVAIVGAPNAGKSSLLNALARREVAIATEEAGTTRDVVEVRLNLNGQLVVLADTAGIRVAEGLVERIGIEKTRERSRQADLVIALYDVTKPTDFEFPETTGSIIRVGSHIDLVKSLPLVDFDHLVSSIDGTGIKELELVISEYAADAIAGIGLTPVRDRQIVLLRSAVSHIDTAIAQLSDRPDLGAEDLRLACDSIGRLTGAVDVEDLLDVVFSSFCIGK